MTKEAENLKVTERNLKEGIINSHAGVRQVICNLYLQTITSSGIQMLVNRVPIPVIL